MSTKSTTKVIVGMSGGVDSSVAALLLLEQGYQVEGLFMKNWDEDDGTEYCTARKDLSDAQSVADRLKIKLHSANFAAEYWDNVFEHFLAEYRAGRTPNPDILCNREIKFKAFLEYAMMLGADFIATGHYARTGSEDGKATLLKGLDQNKDQSYFLHAVGHEELQRSLFPIGEMEKSEVRELAQNHDFVTARKKDSTGICFIGERRFRDFLQQYLPARPGEIHSLQGEILGQHQGLMYHTIGQRQGLGIGGLHNHSEAPWYVVEKNLGDNVLLVAQGNDHPALFETALTATEIYWVAGSEPELPFTCMAKVRYRQADQECCLQQISPAGYRVIFSDPQRAVTPGQSVVFYTGDQCLGGGVIEGGTGRMTVAEFSNLEQQVIALAGVAQTARLVDQISKTGSYPLEFLEPSVHSLFNFDPDSVADVFGGVQGVKLGLHNLSNLLANTKSNENQEVVRYVFGLLYLERKFAANPEMMSVVRSRLEHTSFKAEHFANHVNVLCQSVSGIYQDTLSNLKFRIKVTGSAQHLENPQNADIIRALLLAGIRSAFLWRQLGGRRWKLLLQRRKLLTASQQLSRGMSVV